MTKSLVLFLLLYLQHVGAVTDLQYCAHWIVSKGFGLPEYTERKLVNDIIIYSHDSTFKSKKPCPDWINTTEGKEQWRDLQDWTDVNTYFFTHGFQLATERFNQTGLSDRNIYQGTGCCSLDQKGTYRSFLTHAFNGKEFFSFNVNSETFEAAVPQAIPYKNLMEKDPVAIDVAAFYKKRCLDRLNTFKQAPGVLVRKVPEVRIFQQQKSGSITVTCHVTGFYPRVVQVDWLGPDLQPVDEGVTEVLPNEDDTYQTRKSVTVPEEDVGKHTYSCVVLHISVPENITRVWGGEKAAGAAGAAGAAVWASLGCICLLAAAGVGLGVWWHRRTQG